MSEVPEGLTFAAYHESMRPMFEEAARNAADGHQAEYDHLASIVGAPSFEDLGIDVDRCGWVDVPYRVTVVHEGSVRVHVEDAQRWAGGDMDESLFFSDYATEIEEAIREEMDLAFDATLEIEPHSSNYATFDEYCE